jgi:hypothetical protein
LTGTFLETYDFQFPLDHSPKKFTQKLYKPENVKKGNVRAISTIKSIIAGNFNNPRTKFMVFTFKDTQKFDIRNLGVCNERKKLLVKKLQKRFGYNFKYLIVPEYQVKTGRMAIHYHMLAEIPYLNKEELEDLWGHGYCSIEKVRSPHVSARYVSKELIKQLSDYLNKDIKSSAGMGLRRYYCSNSVLRPDKFYGHDAVRLVKYCLKQPIQLLEEHEFLI